MKRGLTLELAAGEQVQVGDVLVTVEEKSGRRARLRFDAPAEVSIRKVDNSNATFKAMREIPLA